MLDTNDNLERRHGNDEYENLHRLMVVEVIHHRLRFQDNHTIHMFTQGQEAGNK